MEKYSESQIEDDDPPVILLIAQTQGFLENYLAHTISAVNQIGGLLIVSAPIGTSLPADQSYSPEVLFFPPFNSSTVSAFHEAHRWNVLINRRLSRSFNYRSKTMFPTWWVSFLKAKRETQLRQNKIRELNLKDEGAHFSLPRKLNAVRQGLGLGFAAFLLFLGSIRAPVVRSLSLSKIWSSKGRQEVLDLIGSVPPGTVIGEVIKKTRPDLVLIPTLGHELIPTEAIRASAKEGTRSFLLIDNWDNLSSKSIFAALPDYVGTWGPQSSEHAVNIQGINPECVFDLGAPRFESHFKVGAHQGRRATKTGHYIMYCGTSMFSKEDRILEILDDTIGKLELNVPVVYRPHPQRFTKPGSMLRNRNGLIRIDPSTPRELWGSLRPYEFHPDLTLPEKLVGSVFVIGGLTSVLLETQIVGKRYLAMTHHEPFNYSSPRTVYETYDHYRGIEGLPHLTLCKNLRDLPHLVAEHVARPDIPLNSERKTRERSHFLVGSSTEAYSDRLAGAMEVILRKSRDL